MPDTNSLHDCSSLSIQECEILRHLWDAGEPQSVVQVLDRFYAARRPDEKTRIAPATIAVTLSHMKEKGLLIMHRPQKRHGEGRGASKGYYAPNVTRAEVMVAMLEAASRRLTGQPLGYLLAQVNAPPSQETADMSAYGAGLPALITTLKDLRQPFSTA